MRTLESIRERRLERMRLGQATCNIVSLLSDPEVRIALVPLTDAEYQNSLQRAMAREAEQNEHGMLLRDRTQQNVVLQFAAREIDDLDTRVFKTYEEISEMQTNDINHMWDHYSEMVAEISPEIDAITEEEFGELKKVFNSLSTSDLSGRQWYALKRFLLSLTPAQLRDSSLGFSSTSPSTTTSEDMSELAPPAKTSGT